MQRIHRGSVELMVKIQRGAHVHTVEDPVPAKTETKYGCACCALMVLIITVVIIVVELGKDI